MITWRVDHGPLGGKDRMLIASEDGTDISIIRFVHVNSEQCHVAALWTAEDRRGEGLATTGLELLILQYRYFSAEPLNEAMIGLFGTKLAERDDITAWPRVARWYRGALRYIIRPEWKRRL